MLNVSIYREMQMKSTQKTTPHALECLKLKKHTKSTASVGKDIEQWNSYAAGGKTRLCQYLTGETAEVKSWLSYHDSSKYLSKICEVAHSWAVKVSAAFQLSVSLKLQIVSLTHELECL